MCSWFVSLYLIFPEVVSTIVVFTVAPSKRMVREGVETSLRGGTEERREDGIAALDMIEKEGSDNNG